jgi:hypothetical protein
MGSLSNFAENALLNHVANTAFTPAATLFVALCTADPTDAGTGASMSEAANANAYARAAVTFSAAASRRVVQTGAVTFPQATGTWGTISHWAIVTSATYGAGDMYAYGSFVTPFAPVNGNTPTIPTTELEVEIGRTHYSAATISATAPSTLSDSANNFPLFNVGSVLYVSGFTGAGITANNVSMTVVTSTASTITISGPTLISDAAGETVRVALSGGFTDYLVHNWLNRMFRNQAFTKPATYVGLATSLIDDNDVAIGDITEVSTAATAYARVLVNINGGASPTWTVASTGALENQHAITFPTPSASWGLVRSMFLIDSASAAGNILGYDNSSIAPQTPISGDTVQFAATALDLAMS